MNIPLNIQTINYTNSTKLEEYWTQSNFYAFSQAITKIMLISISESTNIC